MINGYGVNGGYAPAWVVRAAVVAAAAAAVITTAPTRIVPAAAYGDANVVVTLTESHVLAARATGNAGVSSALFPTVLSAGRVTATATATGFAAILRQVQATAAGDAGATGTALPNAKLGEASVTAAASVVTCNAHRIRPGASSQPVLATAVAPAGDVTRYSPASSNVTATGRGEASRKANGTSYFLHDGYVLNALAGCSVDVDQTKTKITAGNGSFDFATSDGAGTAFLRRPGAALVTATASGAVQTTVRRFATVSASSGATATVNGVRVRLASVQGTASATRILAQARQSFVATASGAGQVLAVAPGVRTVLPTVLQVAEANSLAIVPGRQFYADPMSATAKASSQTTASVSTTVTGIAQATGSASGRYTFAATASSSSTATSFADPDAFPTSPASAERQMIIGPDITAMVIPFEDRTMMVDA